MNKVLSAFHERQIDQILGLIDPQRETEYSLQDEKYSYDSKLIHDPYKNDPFAEAQKDLEDLV